MSTFVWKPGGVTSGNVFATHAALVAAMAASPGPKFLELDSSAGGFSTFTTDAVLWDLDQVTIQPQSTAATAQRQIVFPDGATASFNVLFTRGAVLLDAANTLTPVVTVASGKACNLWCEAGGIVTPGASAKPFVEVQSGGSFNLKLLFNAQLAPSGAPVLQTDAGGTTTIRCLGGVGAGGATISPSSLTGGGTFNVHASAEALISTTQAGVTGTFSLIWDPIVNQVQASVTVGSGTHTISASTGNINRQKSGKVQVSGSCSGVSAAADVITATLVRDLGGTPFPFATQTVTTTAGQLNYNVTFPPWVDTLPDNLNHTYSIQLAGSQNNTVNQALITANEL